MKTNNEKESIQTILNVVNSKYPKYTSDNPTITYKLQTFKKVICNKEENTKSFNFVDYCMDYINRTEELEVLPDDILNISIIFSKLDLDSIVNTTDADMDNYLKLIRSKDILQIKKLNKIILGNNIASKLSELKQYFTNESGYFDYIDSILETALWRFRVLEKEWQDYDKTVKKIRQDIEVTIDNAIESQKQLIPISHGLRRTLNRSGTLE